MKFEEFTDHGWHTFHLRRGKGLSEESLLHIQKTSAELKDGWRCSGECNCLLRKFLSGLELVAPGQAFDSVEDLMDILILACNKETFLSRLRELNGEDSAILQDILSLAFGAFASVRLGKLMREVDLNAPGSSERHPGASEQRILRVFF